METISVDVGFATCACLHLMNTLSQLWRRAIVLPSEPSEVSRLPQVPHGLGHCVLAARRGHAAHALAAQGSPRTVKGSAAKFHAHRSGTVDRPYQTADYILDCPRRAALINIHLVQTPYLSTRSA